MWLQVLGQTMEEYKAEGLNLESLEPQRLEEELDNRIVITEAVLAVLAVAVVEVVVKMDGEVMLELVEEIMVEQEVVLKEELVVLVVLTQVRGVEVELKVPPPASFVSRCLDD